MADEPEVQALRLFNVTPSTCALIEPDAEVAVEVDPSNVNDPVTEIVKIAVPEETHTADFVPVFDLNLQRAGHWEP